MEDRLQKLLSAAGVCSRRAAEGYIEAGRVTVNGEAARLGAKADPDRDDVRLDGRPLPKRAEAAYLLLNKPRGYVTTLSDEQGRRTVADLTAGCGVRVYPVGRLDLDTEGLLLITNDGALAHNLLSPAKHVPKTYYAEVDGTVTEEDKAQFAQGIDIGGEKQALPAKLEILPEKSPEISRVHLTINEGKFHQVKRMFGAVGKQVLYLKRVSMGGLMLDGSLSPGEYRELTEKELQNLKE